MIDMDQLKQLVQYCVDIELYSYLGNINFIGFLLCVSLVKFDRIFKKAAWLLEYFFAILFIRRRVKIKLPEYQDKWSSMAYVIPFVFLVICICFISSVAS